MNTHHGWRRLGVAAAAMALALQGCASFSEDGGFGTVDRLAKERTGRSAAWLRTPAETEAARARSTDLLRSPLTADAAVELALLNHRGLQASFAELGIAESDRVRAGRLRNPSFSFGHLRGGGDVEIDRAVIFDVLGLLTMPLASEVERQRFEQVQIQAALDAVGIAAEARRSYFSAVAAKQLVAYCEQVNDAAEASGELARRMLKAGNFSKLSQMREQAFHVEATSQLARARHQAVVERERLARALGLAAGPAEFSLPERLPDLPDAPSEPRDAEQLAMDQRLDLLVAKRSTEALARSLGLTRATRVVNVLDAGYADKSQSGHALQQGYRVELELPLFDFGQARVARAEASYMQSVHRTAQVAIHARSEVREAHSAYRTAYEVARRYRDEIVPLRQRIGEENLLRYNGMLISVFDLLADARDQIASVSGYVQALRDYWIAETDLQTAITARKPAP